MNSRYKYTKFTRVLPWRVFVAFFQLLHGNFSMSFQNDMVEYNQCQATLKTLYDLGIPGKVEEFTAYRILMLLHGRNRSGDWLPLIIWSRYWYYFLFIELNLYVGQLTPRQKCNPAVRHALDVQRALATGNYHKLCALYLTAPFMGPYIMDHFIDRERLRGLMVMTRAFVFYYLGYGFLLKTYANPVTEH